MYPIRRESSPWLTLLLKPGGGVGGGGEDNFGDVEGGDNAPLVHCPF